MVPKIIRDEEDENYISYLITHPNGSTGRVDVRMSYLDNGHHHMEYPLRHENLPEGAKLAELFFYPHSKTSKKRKGLGTQVLNYILEDLVTENVNVVFGEATNQGISEFIKNNKFK